MKFIIAYHSSDLDGHLSGALVRYWLEEIEKVKEPIQMLPINYGEPFPYEIIRPEDILFMVDFALQPVQEMVNLNELCHLHWIDHHQTSLADPKDKGQTWMEGIKGIRSAEGAACELVWRYFWHHPETLETNPMPNFVQWIGIYDRWDQRDMGLWENIVLPFQFGMKARETDPATDEGYECWRHILEIKDREVLRSAVTSIILQGLAVKRYADKQLKNFINVHAFTTTWNGITWLVMNGGGINSAKETSAFDPTVHQGVLGYVNVKGNFWRVSMRTDRDDLDLSALARQFGGGGHKKAAGFRIKDLPAELVGPDYGEKEDGQPDEGTSA